jgi:ADP-heptose:LPS heptosyltransferase
MLSDPSQSTASAKVIPIMEDKSFQLSSVAFENNHSQVFRFWIEADHHQQLLLAQDRYIFFSICNGMGSHYDYLHSVNPEHSQKFIETFTTVIQHVEAHQKSFAEEWFKGLNLVIDDWIKRYLVQEAQNLVATAMRTGVNKFPGIAQTTILHGSYLNYLMGRKKEAAEVALKLLQQPYLLPNRREMPKLYFQFMHILAANNHIAEYRQVIWQGISSLYTDWNLRDAFIQQISRTYRGTWRAFLFSESSLGMRIAFLIAQLARITARVRWMNFLAVPRAFEFMHKAWALGLNLSKLTYFKPASERMDHPVTRQNSNPASIFQLRKKSFLVTRAMGGLGDIMMMTPGLLALRRKHPQAQIDFAVPASFHAALKGLPGINLIDINNNAIDMTSYSKWVNLTDCPAGRRESLEFPDIRTGRIESFAKAMGISQLYLRLTKGFKPFYQLTRDETEWAAQYLKELNPRGLPVVAIQPFAADSYRNWPHMRDLALELAQNHCVLVFHHELIHDFSAPNMHTILKPIRQSIALLSLSEKLIAIDSSFLHIAAALDLKTISIFGPTSGKVRTKRYKHAIYVAPKKSDFPCYPCWRHEYKPCHITNSRESICLRSIGLESIRAINDKLPKSRQLVSRFIEHVKYGSQ